MIGLHDQQLAQSASAIATTHSETKFVYTFQNFFHPFAGELVQKLNEESLSAMLDPEFLAGLTADFFKSTYSPAENAFGSLPDVKYFPKTIDVSVNGPCSNYNWELLFHIPITIAVNLSNTQRFAESQHWFHYVFDPTSTKIGTTPEERYWKFLAFRQPGDRRRIEDIVKLLSIPKTQLSATDQAQQDDLLHGYFGILNTPFQPFVVARTRPLAFQYYVVMKYLDNLIAWGDQLFLQDTLESINEATQMYVLASNLLGARPQRNPQLGKTKAKSFAQLKAAGLGPVGDALVDLEGVFPANLASFGSGGSTGGGDGSPLFGIGRALYFCIPPNDKMLGYWDTVADRLFKIRHCMNIAGVVRPLALFDPPIDPGMLVKAAAAGIDIGSVINGLNQPIGPVRAPVWIQKALELCGEVRNLGNALLSAFEKGKAEELAQLRQTHEIQIQRMTQNVRFLQWQNARETATSLLTSRDTALERLHYYEGLLGLKSDGGGADGWTIDFFPPEAQGLNEGTFDAGYKTLVGKYSVSLSQQNVPVRAIVNGSSLADSASGSPNGGLLLIQHEDQELNRNLPTARDWHVFASAAHSLMGGFAVVPTELSAKIHFWGIGGDVKQPIGRALIGLAKVGADIASIASDWESAQAGMASKTASYQRRSDDWLHQYNLTRQEVMQIGRQILTSLIMEQSAHHEYLTVIQQGDNAEAVDKTLRESFSNAELYGWMQGELSRLYYEYYRFAFDTARRAEQTMKQELMRPELDAQDFVKFNYWDGGRKGLLSGEALYLDLKRMELAYHENNKRELELTKHVSLRQLDPVALVALKSTGSCQVSIPEWLYDLDGPGHYMRRIKSVAISIPAVAGPYSSVSCTLTLLGSSLRNSAIAGDDYLRQGKEDDRFVDYIGAVQSVVTSSGQMDSGLFETNLRDERFLPFEGAGAISIWKLDLPKDYRSFDYGTIADAVLHVRHTARQGVDQTKVKKGLDDLFSQVDQSHLALVFHLGHEFPTEWAAFVSKRTATFKATIRKDDFPYFTQSKAITIVGWDLYAEDGPKHHIVAGNQSIGVTATADFLVDLPEDGAGPTQVLTRSAMNVYLVVRYSLS
jgi:hypothetical protein